MKKVIKYITSVLLVILAIFVVACGEVKQKVGETLTLDKTVLSEVEFENSEKVKIKQTENLVEITGEIEAMSVSQKNAFGVDGVTHVVVVKFMFDKERTIDTFEIKGDVTKVYSTDKMKENYVGSISGLLDNDSGDDAYCYLILSANTKEYLLTCDYTDSTSSKITLKINATLVTANEE